MDYLQLLLPSVLAFAADHLPWLLGAAAGLAVLWSPPMRRLRARAAPASLIAAQTEETTHLRAQLAAAQERIRVLERAIAAAPPAGPVVRRLDARRAESSADGRVPTPV